MVLQGLQPWSMWLWFHLKASCPLGSQPSLRNVYGYDAVPQGNGVGQQDLGRYFNSRAYEIFVKPLSFAWVCLMPEASLDPYDKGFGHLA